MVTIWPQISGGPHLLLKGVTLTVLPISGLGLATKAIWVPLESLGQAAQKSTANYCTRSQGHNLAFTAIKYLGGHISFKKV